MRNLNEEINRFKELLLAEHGLIKLFSEQQTTGNTTTSGAEKTDPPLPPALTPEPPLETPMATPYLPPPETPAPPSQKTESEFYEEEDYEDYTEDGWDVGETNFTEELLQDALNVARDFLEYELDYTDDEVNELSELDYIDILRENGQLELADQIEGLYFMISEDPTKPYDSIGGHSPKDIEDAFNKMMKKNIKK